MPDLDPDPAPASAPLTPAEIESGIAFYEGMLRSGGLDAQAKAIIRADIATLMQNPGGFGRTGGSRRVPW